MKAVITQSNHLVKEIEQEKTSLKYVFSFELLVMTMITVERYLYFRLELAYSIETQSNVKTPFSGYENLPLVSLEEALEPVNHLMADVPKYVYIAKENCHEPMDGLTQDESASIMLYTMEWKEESLYRVLNSVLRSEDSQKIKPWFLYLKLIITALKKLPPWQGTVWRGVNIDLSKQFVRGQRGVWWSFTTASSDGSAVQSFLPNDGPNTMFTIDSKTARSIPRHSYFCDEKEVLFMPGFNFEVTSIMTTAPGKYIISLKEIDAPWYS